MVIEVILCFSMSAKQTCRWFREISLSKTPEISTTYQGFAKRRETERETKWARALLFHQQNFWRKVLAKQNRPVRYFSTSKIFAEKCLRNRSLSHFALGTQWQLWLDQVWRLALDNPNP